MPFLNPYQITSDLMVLGKDWAEKDASASQLETVRKTVLAQFFSEHFKECGRVSEAEKLAEGDKRYEEFLIKMVQLRKEANIAKVNYDSKRVEVDLIRTLEATNRATMGIR